MCFNKIMVFLDDLNFRDAHFLLDNFHLRVRPQTFDFVMDVFEVTFVVFHCLVNLLNRIIGEGLEIGNIHP